MGGCGPFGGGCGDPTVVRVRDRVTAKEIQEVWFSNGIVVRLIRKSPNAVNGEPGWAVLFDCKKSPCMNSPIQSNGREFKAGEQLLFTFEEPQQIELAEFVRRLVGAIASYPDAATHEDVPGTVTAVLSDGTSFVTAAGKSFPLGVKTSAIIFEFQEDTPNLCEVMLKLYTDVHDTGNPEVVMSTPSVTILNTDAPGTSHPIDVTYNGRVRKWVWAHLHNATTVALTVDVLNEFVDAAAVTRRGLVTSIGIAAGTSVSFLLQFPGGPAATPLGQTFRPIFRLDVKNDATPGASAAVSGRVDGQDAII